MVRARIGVLAISLFLVAGAARVVAQEIVLTDGSRLAGTVERYEGGFAYIRLFKETGKTVLTTMPESAIDKAATQLAQATASEAVEADGVDRTGPFKLPHNDLSATRPGIADVAADEKERRADAVGSGAATGRVYRNGERAAGIPSERQIEALADLREQPRALPDMDVSARIAGLRFYEARLETLTSTFALLDEEWADMWRHCTPVTYVGGPASSPSAPEASRPDSSFHEAVVSSFRGTKPVDDRWSISCIRRDSDFVARGRQVVEVYDVVFGAYADFATNTGQVSQTVARALPPKPR